MAIICEEHARIEYLEANGFYDQGSVKERRIESQREIALND